MSVAVPVISSIDGDTRRIYLLQGVTDFHWIDDIYKEYRNLRRTDESLRKWEPFLSASGNEPKGQGKATPRLLKLLTDSRSITTKVVPYDESGTINVTGEAITDIADTDPELFDITTITSAVIIQYEPPSAEVIVIDNITKRLDYGGIVHFDATSSYTGQEHPSGTAAEPVNNVSDVIAIASLYGIREVHIISGTFTIPSTMHSWVFVGVGGDATIVVNGNDLSGSKIEGLNVIGNLGITDGTLKITECVLSVTNASGTFRDCILLANNSLKAGISIFTDCESGVPGTTKPILDLQGVAATGRLSNYSGGIEIKNMTHASSTFSIDADPASIDVLSTNTAGTLRIRGVYDLNSTGSTTNIVATGMSGGVWTEQEKQASLAYSKKASDNAEQANLKL